MMRLPIRDHNLAPSTAAVPYEPPNPDPARTRAALVNPPDPSSSDNFRLVPPLGLGYIASFARAHGHHVDVFDLALHLRPDARWLGEAGLFDAYAVYGFTTYSDTFLTTADLAREVKRVVPCSYIVLGGYHASLLDREVLRDFPFIDAIVRREGEHAFREVLDGIADESLTTVLPKIAGVTWRDRDGVIQQNPPRIDSFDQESSLLPVTDLKFRPAHYRTFWHAATGQRRRTLNIVGSRGCPKRCTFCSIITLNPLWRARSVRSLMAEISLRHERSPFEHVEFQDANSFVDPRRSVEFARALHAFNASITWSGTATPDQIVRHGEVLPELGRLNCAYLELGIESGNEASLRRFNKRTDVAINEEALALLTRAGIAVGLDFIMFEPEMTFDDLCTNFEFLLRNEFGGEWPCEFLFQELQLYPGTALRSRLWPDIVASPEVHRMPATPFFDRGVEGAFRLAAEYRRTVQSSANRAIQRLNAVVNSLLLTEVRGAIRGTPLAELCQRALACEIRLRHEPYGFFSRLLHMGPDVATSASLRDFDIDPARVLLRDATQLLAELEGAASEMGLALNTGYLKSAATC